MNGEPGEDAPENVRALIVFPLAHEWKQVLLMHGCTLGENEYGETVIFPEDTTRTLLLSRTGRATNRYRIQLPDGLELREGHHPVLCVKKTSKQGGEVIHFLNMIWENRKMQWRPANVIRKRLFERHTLHRKSSTRHLP